MATRKRSKAVKPRKTQRARRESARKDTRTETQCVVLYPSDVGKRWNRAPPTIWRMERDGRLPARDFFIGGRPVGWRLATILTAERGPAPGAGSPPAPIERAESAHAA